MRSEGVPGGGTCYLAIFYRKRNLEVKWNEKNLSSR